MFLRYFSLHRLYSMSLQTPLFPHQTIAGRNVYYLEVLVQVSLSDWVIHFYMFALGKVTGRKDLANS